VNFEASPEQAAIEAEARRFAQTELAPRAEALDRTGGFPVASLGAAARGGWLGINVARALGGLEAGAVSYALAIMECARACAATTVAMCVSNMVAEVIAAFGTTAQRERWVPSLCDGRLVVGAFALSEAGAGSDPSAMQTRARRTANGWVIDGAKLWITSGSHAGLFVVWARTREGGGSKGISCFLVPGDAPGLHRGVPETKMGLRGSTTVPIAFDAVEVGDDALLHDEGGGFPVALMALDGGRIGIAAQAWGIGRAATDAAAVQLADGPSPSALALWAESETELAAARLLILKAASLKDRGQRFTREAAHAKVFASERAFAACDRALEILGDRGFLAEAGVERAYRDVRVTMIYEGTSEIQRVVIARELVRARSSP